MTPVGRWIGAPFVWAALVTWLGGASTAWAQELEGADLVQALRSGGYVLVVRNARSPEEVPPENKRAPANLNGEREIDPHGQGQMSVLAYAFRELEIPVGDAWTGPAYRSRQSGKYLGFGEEAVDADLAEHADPKALLSRAAKPPQPGRNTVLVTHGSLIEQAFGRAAQGIDTAETLVFRPHDGRADLVARLAVEDWAKLAVK